jgi:hypothetical protein
MYIQSIVLAAVVGYSSAFAPAAHVAPATSLFMGSEPSTEDRRSFVTKVSIFSVRRRVEDNENDQRLKLHSYSLDLQLPLLRWPLPLVRLGFQLLLVPRRSNGSRSLSLFPTHFMISISTRKFA